jgi:hypothetical protein
MNKTDSTGDPWIQKRSQPLLTKKKSTKITFKGDTWIRQRAQPLLTQKKSMKTEPLLSPKARTKLILKVMRGFVIAHSPC